MKIIPLSEGAFTVDKTKKFVPFNTVNDNLQQRTIGSLLVEIQPFVIVTSEDILLVDTGLGFKINGELQIHQNLIQAGIHPSTITKVLMSHLHKDHAGGMVTKNEVTGNYEMAFPTATYYIQKHELQFASVKESSSYVPEIVNFLQQAHNVTIIEGNGVIDGYIKYEVTGAHSPYHQVFWIVDGGETIFYGGDVAPQLQQMKSRFIAKYDFDGKKCMELRQKWWLQAEKEKWTFLFYHDILTPIYNL